MRTQEPTRQTAFTLIELLVVIAIIALLVSILLPSLRKAKTLAQEVVCMTNVKSIAGGQTLYSSEHDGALAPLKIYEGLYGSSRAFGIAALGSYLGGSSDGTDSWQDFVDLGKELNGKYMCPATACSSAMDPWGTPLSVAIKEGYASAYPFNLPIVELGEPGFVSGDQIGGNGYWISWMPDYPLEHSGPAEKIWHGRWPNIATIERVASEFVIMREKEIAKPGTERPTQGFTSTHQDGTLMYGYGDGHVERGEWCWYIATE